VARRRPVSGYDYRLTGSSLGCISQIATHGQECP
jgi:hypothetical protein